MSDSLIQDKSVILFFPVAEMGTIRVLAENISFWYYDDKSKQTMIHLKCGACLRVEQHIDIVDKKIMESREPVIGKKIAEFWEQLIIETYNNLNKNERQSLCS
jgi:hypothetical protein